MLGKSVAGVDSQSNHFPARSPKRPLTTVEPDKLVGVAMMRSCLLPMFNSKLNIGNCSNPFTNNQADFVRFELQQASATSAAQERHVPQRCSCRLGLSCSEPPSQTISFLEIVCKTISLASQAVIGQALASTKFYASLLQRKRRES